MKLYPDVSSAFIHIPKTGGTSIKYKMADIEWVDPEALVVSWNHKTYLDCSAEIPSGFLCFAVKRDPWDRALSLYSWLKQLYVNPPFTNFPEFVSWVTTNWPDERPPLLKEQVDYLYDETKTTLLVPFIIDFELLETAWNIFASITIGRPDKMNLEVVNRSKHIPFDQFYKANRTYKNLVSQDLFPNDCSMLGYSAPK